MQKHWFFWQSLLHEYKKNEKIIYEIFYNNKEQTNRTTNKIHSFIANIEERLAVDMI